MTSTKPVKARRAPSKQLTPAASAIAEGRPSRVVAMGDFTRGGVVLVEIQGAWAELTPEESRRFGEALVQASKSAAKLARS